MTALVYRLTDDDLTFLVLVAMLMLAIVCVASLIPPLLVWIFDGSDSQERDDRSAADRAGCAVVPCSPFDGTCIGECDHARRA